MAEVEALTSKDYSSQMSGVLRRYSRFMDEYGGQIYENIYSGEARNAAQQELQELRRIQERCPIKI